MFCGAVQAYNATDDHVYITDSMAQLSYLYSCGTRIETFTLAASFVPGRIVMRNLAGGCQRLTSNVYNHVGVRIELSIDFAGLIASYVVCSNEWGLRIPILPSPHTLRHPHPYAANHVHCSITHYGVTQMFAMSIHTTIFDLRSTEPDDCAIYRLRYVTECQEVARVTEFAL